MSVDEILQKQIYKSIALRSTENISKKNMFFNEYLEEYPKKLASYRRYSLKNFLKNAKE